MRHLLVRGFAAFVDLLAFLNFGGVAALAWIIWQGLYVPPVDLPRAVLSAAVLVGGLIEIVFVFGSLYVGIGIYENTRRMVDALEDEGPKRSRRAEAPVSRRIEPTLR